MAYIHSGAFDALDTLHTVMTGASHVCCLVRSHVACTAPKLILSSCEGLLGTVTQLIGIFGLIGNCVVLYEYVPSMRPLSGQAKLADKGKTYILLVANMVFSDLLVSVYL